jgi:hypothetical protein
VIDTVSEGRFRASALAAKHRVRSLDPKSG